MILDVIVEDKLKRLPEHKKRISEEKMKELALSSTRKINSFYEALKKDGLSVIGEFKKASPSHGNMNNKITLEERIKQYGESADAISCLTEEDHFKGSTEYLKQIRNMTQLPIIRKDFIIDPYQVYEARVIGADALQAEVTLDFAIHHFIVAVGLYNIPTSRIFYYQSFHRVQR